MAKKVYSVAEKEAHYNKLIAQSEQAQKRAEKAALQARRVSYGAGYNQAVKDCRKVLREKRKK